MIALLLSLPALAVDVARDGTINTTTMSGLGPNFRLWLDPTLSNPGEVLGRAVDRSGRLVPGAFLIDYGFTERKPDAGASTTVKSITLKPDAHLGILEDPVSAPPGGAPSPVPYGKMVRPSDVAAEDRITVTVQDVEQTGDRLTWCGNARQQDATQAQTNLDAADLALVAAIGARAQATNPAEVAIADQAVLLAQRDADRARKGLARATTSSYGFTHRSAVMCDPILHVRQEFRTAGELLEVPGVVNVIPGLRVALGVSRKRERWVTIHSWLRERRYPTSWPKCDQYNAEGTVVGAVSDDSACQERDVSDDARKAFSQAIVTPITPLTTELVKESFEAGRAAAMDEQVKFSTGVGNTSGKREWPRPVRALTSGDLSILQDIVVAGRAAQPDAPDKVTVIDSFAKLRGAACANQGTSGVVGSVYVGHLFVSSASSTAVRTWLKGKGGRASVGPTLTADEASGVSNATYSRVVGYSIDWCSPEAQAQALGYESMRQRVQAYLYRPNGKKRSQHHWNRIAKTDPKAPTP
jgi:hypothetical protein